MLSKLNIKRTYYYYYDDGLLTNICKLSRIYYKYFSSIQFIFFFYLNIIDNVSFLIKENRK